MRIFEDKDEDEESLPAMEDVRQAAEAEQRKNGPAAKGQFGFQEI